MSRQYPNRSFAPSDNSSRRFPTQNDFPYFQYPPHQQTVESNHRPSLPFNRITAAATSSASTPHYHFENPSAASFTRHPPWFDDDREEHNNQTKRQRSLATNTSNSQSYHRPHERKRSRPDENERSHHYQPYSNHRQTTNPTPRHVPSLSHPLHNRHFHQQSSPIPSPHRAIMHQRPSPSFLLNDLLHRVIDAHAASYSDNHVHFHHPPPASIDLIAYAWMSPNHDLLSLPTAFSIQFGDFFDLIIPDETPVVGLTDSELERLPTMIYKKTDINITIDDKCAVCLSEYVNGEKLKRLRCKHYFHSECIDPWLKTSTRCPVCRGEQTN